MNPSIRAGIVVLALLSIFFFAVRKPAAHYMSEESYKRRVTALLSVTASAFLLPFAGMVVVNAAIFLSCLRDRAGRIGTYAFLMLCLPPYSRDIIGPLIGGTLLDLSHYRLLTLCALLSIYSASNGRVSSRRGLDSSVGIKWALADYSLLAYIALNVVLYIPYETVSITMRRSVGLMLDVIAPYLIFRYGLRTVSDVREVLACFVIGVVSQSAIAVLEVGKTWHVYAHLRESWGIGGGTMVFRDGLLRAEGAGLYAIPFGYVMCLALVLSVGVISIPKRDRMVVFAFTAAMGLAASLSRGPWVAAVAACLCFYMFAGKGLVNGSKVIATLLVGIMGATFTPLGDKIIRFIPGFGEVDSENVDYRVELARTTWNIVEKYPLFGTPFFLQYMEHLRQGQGIIDPVNSFALIALGNGFVGLFFYSMVFLSGLLYPMLAIRKSRTMNIYDRRLGVGLAACALATIIVLGTCSPVGTLALIPWVFSAISVSYAQLVGSSTSDSSDEARKFASTSPRQFR